MTNEKFNNNFKIEKNNEVDINQFLKEDLLNFMADFKEKNKIKFDILFTDKIYIKFYTKNLFYREGMSAKSIDKMSVGQYYIMVKFANELVKIIDNK